MDDARDYFKAKSLKRDRKYKLDNLHKHRVRLTKRIAYIHNNDNPNTSMDIKRKYIRIMEDLEKDCLIINILIDILEKE